MGDKREQYLKPSHEGVVDVLLKAGADDVALCSVEARDVQLTVSLDLEEHCSLTAAVVHDVRQLGGESQGVWLLRQQLLYCTDVAERCCT